MLSVARGCGKKGRKWWILLPVPRFLLPQYAVPPEPDLIALFLMHVLQKNIQMILYLLHFIGETVW